jgi:hypothetical protein
MLNTVLSACVQMGENVSFQLFDQPIFRDHTRVWDSVEQGLPPGYDDIFPAALNIEPQNPAWLQQAEHWTNTIMNPITDARNRLMRHDRLIWQANAGPILNLSDLQLDLNDNEVINQENFAHDVASFFGTAIGGQLAFIEQQSETGFALAKIQIKMMYRVQRFGQNNQLFEMMFETQLLRTLLGDGDPYQSAYEGYANTAFYQQPAFWADAGIEWLRNEINATLNTIVDSAQNPFGEQYAANNPGRIEQMNMLVLGRPRTVAGCNPKLTRIASAGSFPTQDAAKSYYELLDVPSTNNNCLLAVIRYAMGEHFPKGLSPKVWYSKMRTAIGVLPGQKIPLEACAQLAQFLRLEIIVYYDRTNVLDYGQFLPYGQDPLCTVSMLYENEHVLWVRQRGLLECPRCHCFFNKKGMTSHVKHCVVREKSIIVPCCDCGRKVQVPKTELITTPEQVTQDYLCQFHVCNQRTLSFYQRMILHPVKKEKKSNSNRYVIPLFVPNDDTPVNVGDDNLPSHVCDLEEIKEDVIETVPAERKDLVRKHNPKTSIISH